MAGPSFTSTANHLYSIGGGVTLVLDMVPVAGFFAAMQHQTDANKQPANASNLQVVALFDQYQGQVRQIWNEYVFTDLHLAS